MDLGDEAGQAHAGQEFGIDLIALVGRVGDGPESLGMGEDEVDVRILGGDRKARARSGTSRRRPRRAESLEELERRSGSELGMRTGLCTMSPALLTTATTEYVV